MKDCRSCSYKNILEAKDVERETAAPEAIDHSWGWLHTQKSRKLGPMQGGPPFWLKYNNKQVCDLSCGVTGQYTWLSMGERELGKGGGGVVESGSQYTVTVCTVWKWSPEWFPSKQSLLSGLDNNIVEACIPFGITAWNFWVAVLLTRTILIIIITV